MIVPPIDERRYDHTESLQGIYMADLTPSWCSGRETEEHFRRPIRVGQEDERAGRGRSGVEQKPLTVNPGKHGPANCMNLVLLWLFDQFRTLDRAATPKASATPEAAAANDGGLPPFRDDSRPVRCRDHL